MRAALIALLCAVSALTSFPQGPVPTTSKEKTERTLQQALIGDWAGYLEYRDYSEPPSSTKRVQLPTWLNVSQSPTGLTLHYVYDDGPGKVVGESEQLTLDLTHNTYSIGEAGHAADVYHVDGFDSLRDGYGTLVLTGSGTDNSKPAENRLTLTIRRNIIEWLLEARPAGSTEPFAFRHLFRLTRAQAPAATAPRK
jgi:hypothetical protein